MGYLGKRELTEDRFLQINGDRYYRTGDIVKWTHTGKLSISDVPTTR